MGDMNIGVDTGDSFLAQIDQLMGAPPIGGRGGKKDGGGGNLIQGIFQALGIGNKPINPKNAEANTTAAPSVGGPEAPTTQAKQATAIDSTPAQEPGAASGIDSFMPGRNPNEDLILSLGKALGGFKK